MYDQFSSRTWAIYSHLSGKSLFLRKHLFGVQQIATFLISSPSEKVKALCAEELLFADLSSVCRCPNWRREKKKKCVEKKDKADKWYCMANFVDASFFFM